MTRGGAKTESGLTVRQESFCNEYLIDLDTEKAALRAGYAKTRAARFGRELMRDSRIRERIQLLMDRRAQTTDVTPERVVLELARIGFSDLREIVSWGPGGSKWKDSAEISDDAAAVVKEIQETEREMDDGGTFRTKKIQMHDKMAALKELAKHTGVGVGERGLSDKVEEEVARQKAGEMEVLFKDIDNWRSEQEKALPEERSDAQVEEPA